MKTRAKKALEHVRGRALLYAVVVVVLLGGFALFVQNGGVEEEVLTVSRGPFKQDVSVSGKVVAAEDVTLAFAEGGRVVSITVEVGNRVAKGQALASLASQTLQSDLRAAQADLSLKRAEARNTSVNVDEVRSEQDSLVESAYRTLLSEDLAAVPESSYGVTAPVITGLYAGPEGSYRIRITEKENSPDIELRTFGIEVVSPVEVLDDEPTELGTRGLFIDFPDALSNYEDTIWNVAIPNTKGASYLQNRRSYEEALSTRNRVIGNAEASLRGGPTGSVAEAEVQRAEAEVARIQAAIAERTLRAPFTGVITAVHVELGETATAGEAAVSLISAGAFQIESYVPEVNIALLEVGDPSEITLDAYGDDVVFPATVVAIDPAETVRDGVSTYRTILEFAEQDPRIRSGMTANVRITTDEREGVLAVPRGVVSERDGKKFVRVLSGDEPTEREITTGAISSFGTIEVLVGLSEGDVVVVP